MFAQLPGVQSALTALSADDPHEIGGYRLHARLGSGGMGVVYLAYTPGGRPIALKAVRREFAADPEFRERFAQEVASARRIHGLFTAQVVDSGEDDHTPWLATAYVPGPSLHQVVQRHGPLPVRTVLLLVASIAEALQEIHRVGVVHRDLKPANVLIAGDGPRVIDFGIARAADAAALTGVGLRIGTAAFMAPEQALGHPVTSATDVFALGALTGFVAGGVPPFGNGPESGALYRVVHEQPDLGRIPHELHELLAWCLAKHPQDRPATADLIAAVHAHPLVGPRPEFTDGWLPRPVLAEVGGRVDADPAGKPGSVAGHAGSGPVDGAAGVAGTDRPGAPVPEHPQATRAAAVYPGSGPGGTMPYAPSPSLGPGPHQAPDPASGPAPGPEPTPAAAVLPVAPMTPAAAVPAAAPVSPARRDRRRERSRLPLVALAAAALLACGGGAYWFGLPPEEGDTPVVEPATAPSRPVSSAYVPGYPHAELTAPDSGYEFDLRAGKVVPVESAAWYLARGSDAFLLSEESDAYVADASGELTPDDCARGIETRPVTTLPFKALAKERPFCVRSPDQRELAIVRLVEATSAGSVTITVDHFRTS
ncbi:MULTISPECIES: serine/threonine-protein kinase [unclassified Streptomyces]|uniref:serine/threonine-protein kinase n=1 Tax=unclassified Streptomyces TaxID=2593676 RepID=UPI00068CD961|nr:MULTISPECIES: serine/threonine-protein kinase [unclassified Streptomyces]